MSIYSFGTIMHPKIELVCQFHTCVLYNTAEYFIPGPFKITVFFPCGLRNLKHLEKTACQNPSPLNRKQRQHSKRQRQLKSVMSKPDSFVLLTFRFHLEAWIAGRNLRAERL